MLHNGYMDFFILVVSIGTSTNAVEVNMHGSLSIGKDVLSVIRRFMKQNNFNGRRFMSDDSTEGSIIYSTVKAAALCRNLDVCENGFREFIVEYVTALAKAVYAIFDRSLYVGNANEGANPPDGGSMRFIFDNKLKYSLKEIRNILKNANSKISNDNAAYLWTNVVKGICGRIQEAAILLVTERLRGNPKEIHKIKKKLSEQLVIETIILEGEFIKKLCSEHNVCSKSLECTEALNTLMTAFKAMDNDKVKAFVRAFYEVLSDTTFYSKLEEVTANEFQIVLNDMAFSDNVPTKDVLLAVQNTVENRLNSSASNENTVKAKDVELVHVILSDMDHIYSEQKAEPFYRHLRGIYDWTKSGGRLSSIMRQIMNDISDQISLHSNELVLKLINEVRVFLEMTIESEK